jgi:PAS domain S-box-containing protein
MLMHIELCQQAVNASKDAMVAIDSRGLVVMWNPAAERLLGYCSQEMLGGLLDRILPETVRNQHSGFVHGYFTSGAPNGAIGKTLELDAIRRDGTQVPVELSLSAGTCSGEPFVIAILRDISNRRRRERALRESQAKLKVILDSVLAGVVLIEAETHEIVDVNPAAMEMIGLPRDQIVGRVCHRFICPAMKGHCPVTDEGQQVSKMQCVLLRADGSELPVIKQVTDVMIEGHRYLVDSFLDISDQKALMQEAVSQKDLLSKVLANIPAFVFWKDLDCRYLGCNETFARAAGLNDAREIAGKTDYDLVWRDEAELYRNADRQVMQSGEPILGIEEPQTQKDGSQIILLTSKVPLLDTAGKVTGVLGVYHDITARREMEDAVKGHWRFMSQILDSLPGCVAVLDHDGHINMVNRTWSEFAQDNGLSPDYQFEGVNYLDVCRRATGMGCEGATEAAEGIARLLRSEGSSFQMEYPCHGPSEERWFQMRTSTFQHGASTWAVIAHIDVTERKQAELKQDALLKQVESANQELKDFAYVVSHDLKAPLRAIRTLAEWMTTDYGDRLGTEGQEQLRLLVGRAMRMQGLIDGILEYSRIGRVREQLTPVDLNTLVADVIDDLAPPETFAISVEGPLPTVHGEPTRLRQLFQNLLSNAMKYNDKERGTVRISPNDRQDFWEFSVADNGMGIAPEHFQRVFQIFQTLTPRDKSESTGVGLTVAKKIVECHGGRIWLDSKVGEGTVFYFTLPKGNTEIDNEHDAPTAVAG